MLAHTGLALILLKDVRHQTVKPTKNKRYRKQYNTTQALKSLLKKKVLLAEETAY